jgi:uncharacterized coiled-coil protein SlyX
MAQQQVQLAGITGQLHVLATQMSALAVQALPAAPAAPSQPASATIEDRVSSIKAQMVELTARFGEMQDSFCDIGVSVNTLIGDLNSRTVV